MAETPKLDPSRWTGEPDAIAPKALAIALALGAIGFLIVGAMMLG
jgi:hypothetical protein